MNNKDLANYYQYHQDEFKCEYGHEKLLIGLKHYIPQINTTKKIVALDVGCCVGDYIQNLEVLCPEMNKDVIVFEPNPVNIAVLEGKIQNKKNVELHKYCISNQEGSASFYNWKDQSQNHAGNGIAGLRSGGSKICDVAVKRLDNVLHDKYKDEDIIIKFIKVDTEGNDSNVIKSLGNYINKTQYIIFECSDCLDDIRGPGIPNPMKDIVDYLSQNGFDTYRIGTRKLFKVNDEYWNDTYEKIKFWSNCFAIRKEDPLIHKIINSTFDYTY
jgi:FkbM family methyltransferase